MSVYICFKTLPLSHVSLHPLIITGYENKKPFDTWIFLFWFCKLKLKRFLLSTFSPRCKPSKLDDEGLIFYQVLDHQQTFYLAIFQHFKLPKPAAVFIVNGMDTSPLCYGYHFGTATVWHKLSLWRLETFPLLL